MKGFGWLVNTGNLTIYYRVLVWKYFDFPNGKVSIVIIMLILSCIPVLNFAEGLLQRCKSTVSGPMEARVKCTVSGDSDQSIPPSVPPEYQGVAADEKFCCRVFWYRARYCSPVH